MRKMRKLCAFVLGTSMLLGNTGYAAEVVWEQEAAETVWTEGEELEGTRPVEYVTADLVEADLALLEEALPAKKADFSQSVQRKMENVVTLAKDDAVLAAEKLNEIADQDTYEATLHEVLDSYYGEESAFSEAQIAEFAEAVDERAETMLADYAEAKEERDRQTELDYEVGKVLVTFKKGTTKEEIDEIASRMGKNYRLLNTYPINENLPEDKLQRLERVRDYEFPDVACMEIGRDKTVERAERILNELNCVEAAESNGFLQTESLAADMGVNDEYVNEQTYLKQINVPEGWSTWQSSEVTAKQMYVAVLDTGLDIRHEDLKNQYLKDLSVVVTDNGNGIKMQPMTIDNCYRRDHDDGDHGTNVASLIAAQSNNGKGIAGIAALSNDKYDNNDMIKIMAIHMFDSNYYDANGTRRMTWSSDEVLIESIRYAVNNGADVINMSLGETERKMAIEEAINYAHNADVVICAGAGNDGKNSSFYPASYNHVISVGSVDNDNKHSDFSNYCNTVDMVAPGRHPLVCVDNGGYGNRAKGTSLSTPMVSAVAAVLKSMQSEDSNFRLSADDVESILCSTATDLSENGLYGAGRDDYTGYGLLNMNLALETARSRFIKDLKIQNMTATAKDYQSIQLSWKGMSWAERYVIYRSTEQNGTYTKIGSLKYSDLNSTGFVNRYFTDTGLDTGTTYYYKVRAAAPYGTSFRFSDYSAVASAKCIVAVPTGLVLAAAKGKITASWKKVAGAEGYQIWRSESKNGTYKRIHTVTSGATLSYADTTVKAGTTYYYKIRAYRKPNGTAVFSGYSALVSKKAI